MSEERKTIHEQLESFKKHLWSSEKPMDFATDVVEEMLLEIQRQWTIMRAGLDEIDRHWETHKQGEDMSNGQLVNLMDNLGGKRRGFYAQYLSQNEYREFIARQTNFEAFAKAQAMAFGQEAEGNGEETKEE
tara:strand:+ start:17 stop:412 length:396 start_codon:yes stop_codon:yes gene_type:complete